ncbi:hypothetical protein [Glutamicibacter sp. MCAF14]|uniref:hypothetical protein n=1 Tax=Glutamicibacter sp. MCAF14 TaxID=3233043 RepID=UPI003F932F4C
MITEQQAITLANLLAMIRPGDWRQQQLTDLFYEHRTTTHPFSDIAEVAIRAANNPDIKSPTVIFLDGKHWNLGRNTKRPKNPPCEEHAGEDAHTCRCCQADILLGERPETMIGKRIHPAGKPNAFGAQAVKQALQALKSPESHVEASETTRGVAPF